MRRDGVFELSPATMRILDVRLTERKFMVTLEAYEYFTSTRMPTLKPQSKRPGRKPKQVYLGKVAKHKSIKHSSDDLRESIANYVEKEFKLAEQ